MGSYKEALGVSINCDCGEVLLEIVSNGKKVELGIFEATVYSEFEYEINANLICENCGKTTKIEN